MVLFEMCLNLFFSLLTLENDNLLIQLKKSDHSDQDIEDILDMYFTCANM